MAIRNIFRNRRRSLLTGFTMVGGFVLMAITFALVEGSYGELIDAFTGQHTGHAQISHPEWAESRSLYKTLRKVDQKLAAIQADPAVRAVAPRIHGDSLVYFKKGTFGGQVVGIDPALERQATSYHQRISSGRALEAVDAYEAVLGQSIAKVLGVKAGDSIVLISQGADGSIANDIFAVVGIIGSAQESRDDYRIYLPLGSAAEFFSLQGRVHELAVMLHDLGDTRRFVAGQPQQPGQLSARPWQEVEIDFYRTMQIDKKGNRFTFFILMVIIGVGVLNTILMTTLERTREFGVLKAMGTLPRHIFALIVLESLALALLATAVGAIIAFFAISYLSVDGINFEEPLKVAGMVIEEHRARLVPVAFVVPGLTVLITTAIASLYPAARAARLPIADCLRDY